MSGPSYSTYGTINVGSNTITFPATSSGDVIVVHASSPNSAGASNIGVSGAGATWTSAPSVGAPYLFCFIGQLATVGSTSVTLTATTANIGVGSYVLSIWNPGPSVPASNFISVNNYPTDLVSLVTPTFAYAANQVIIGASTSYDPFGGATPPVWSNGYADNLIAYQVNVAGGRPLWVSWIQPTSPGSATYTSPYADSSSTGVAVSITTAVALKIVMLI